VRVWDLEREGVVQEVKTGSGSCVSALTALHDPRLLVAGTGDGCLRLFDTRSQGHSLAPAAALTDHKQWILHTTVSQARPNIVSFLAPWF
jgi:WD40 repeat protein